jgi:hypothetical protein
MDELRRQWVAEEIQREEWDIRYMALETELKQWRKDKAPRDTLLRKFWVEGSLYTHLGTSASNGWNLVTIPEFHRLLQKQYALDLKHVNQYSRELSGSHYPHSGRGWPTSIDHLEVFIPRGSKIL